MAKRNQAVIPEVVDPAEDQRLARADGDSVVAWMKGIAAFWGKAKQLEADALTVFETSKALQVPKDGGEDELMQRFVRTARGKIAVVEDHWTITTMVHRLHRRLTAARAVAVEALDKSIARGTMLHEQYKAAEARRVREKEEALRREAEAQAQRDRQAELDRLEAEALEKESALEELTERERKFLAELGGGAQPAIAAKYAGYRDPAKASARLLELPKIQAALKAAAEAKQVRAEAARVAEKPLDVEPIEDVEADIRGKDRERFYGEVVDRAAFVEAFRSGQYGIPGDLLTIDQVALNKYATDLGERLNRWPGVRAKKKTTIL